MWCQILGWLDYLGSSHQPTPHHSQKSASLLLPSLSVDEGSRAHFPTHEPLPQRFEAEVDHNSSHETSTPLWPRTTNPGEVLDDASLPSPTEKSHRYFPGLPLVQSPVEAPDLFQPLRHECYRYYPELPLVQSPVQVSDLGRPGTPMPLDMCFDETSDESGTLDASNHTAERLSNISAGPLTRCENLLSGLARITSQPRSLKRWSKVKARGGVGLWKNGARSGISGPQPAGHRWSKSVRKATRWLSLRKHRNGSYRCLKPAVNLPRRRNAQWRTPSMHDYSAYFPRQLCSKQPGTVPMSPSSVYSQDSYQPSTLNTAADGATDDERDVSHTTPSSHAASPLPSKSLSYPWRQSITGWLCTMVKRFRVRTARWSGRVTFRTALFVLYASIFVASPLTAWAAFRIGGEVFPLHPAHIPS